MGCKHRFFDELIPTWEIKDLFIGTFNPSWNSDSSSALYFYGRKRNNFWDILPNIFGGESLKKSSKDVFVNYLKEHNIGLTDLVTNVVNADENNSLDKDNLTKVFSDATLNKYELEFATDIIKEFILRNKSTLKGVYFTRSTDSGIKTIWKEWLAIEALCNENSIDTCALMTPANYRGGAVLKTKLWLEKIKL